MNIIRMLQLFTNQIKEFVNTNLSFSNKNLLEGIKDTDVYAWNKAAKHAGDTTSHLSETEREILNTVASDGYAKQNDLEALQTEVATTKKSVSDGKTQLATSITEKGSSVASDATFAEMASAVDNIFQGHDTSGVTAGAGDVLTGKAIVSAGGAKVNGTMVNNGAVSKSLGINGTYTIPAGYHNGSGKVTQNLTTKAEAIITPTTKDQTIAASQYLTGVQTIKGDANLTAANIKNGVTIFGVKGTSPTPGATTAGANDVITGKNIVSTDGTTVAGVIPDRSHVGGNAPGVVSLNASQHPSVAVSIGDVVHWEVNGDGVTRLCIRPPWGIYGGISGTRGGDGYVGIPVTLLGNAAASQVLSGVSFTSQNGYKINGSMVNRGAVSQSLAINGTYTIPAGYHNGSGKVRQSIPTKAAATIRPGATSQTIPAGCYLTGAQTILGDGYLHPKNIRSRYSIFSVAGTHNQHEIFGGTDPKSIAPAFSYCFASTAATGGNGSYGTVSSTWWETTGSKWTQPTNFATYRITTAYTGTNAAYSMATVKIFNKNGYNTSSYTVLPNYSSYYFLFTIIEKMSETSYARTSYFVKGNAIDITYYSCKDNGMSFRITGLESGYLLRIYGKSTGSAPSSDHTNLAFEIFY